MTDYTNVKCWYCGQPATTKDHMIPLRIKRARMSRRKKLKFRLQIKSMLNGKVTVPACFTCNQLKGDMLLEEFRQFVVDRIANEQYFKSKDAIAHRLALIISKNQNKFYGEIGG